MRLTDYMIHSSLMQLIIATILVVNFCQHKWDILGARDKWNNLAVVQQWEESEEFNRFNRGKSAVVRKDNNKDVHNTFTEQLFASILILI